MAKGLLILLLSATLAVVLVSDAATISTAVEVEEVAEHCQQQHMINACQRYLVESSRCSTGIRTRSAQEGSDWREEFPRCCEQLEQIDDQCRCEAIEQVAQQQHQQLQGREREEMLETARSLPNLCRISSQRCNIRSRRGQY